MTVRRSADVWITRVMENCYRRRGSDTVPTFPPLAFEFTTSFVIVPSITQPEHVAEPHAENALSIFFGGPEKGIPISMAGMHILDARSGRTDKVQFVLH